MATGNALVEGGPRRKRGPASTRLKRTMGTLTFGSFDVLEMIV